MSGEFAGRVALVTGAGSGIGRATALAFAEQGARVVVNDRDTDGGDETVRLIVEQGGEAVLLVADVSLAQDVEGLITKVVETFGRIDFAFNNAGIEGPSHPVAEGDEAAWDRVIDVNLKGTWLCMRAELRQMLAQGHGVIVNCASVAGLVGFPTSAPYVASKHGVIGLTKTAALEVADRGIRVNAVCPGVIDTAMVERALGTGEQAAAATRMMEPVGRMGRPEEIASAVLWLCSDGAAFVTGESLVVDGGLVAR
jgi:NAD(P)-dependent dehydrogenase (short-subunit alcohol dehydrogenase family)